MKFSLGGIELFQSHFYYDFMAARKKTVGLSLVMMLASLYVIIFQGIHYSIDFLGGSEIQVVADPTLTRDQFVSRIQASGFADHADVMSYQVQTTDAQKQQGFMIRLKKDAHHAQTTTGHTSAPQLVEWLKSQPSQFVEVISVKNISGKIGKEEEQKGYWALGLACLGILIYIAVRFDARFAPGAVICLIHNVLIALGVMTFLGKPFNTASIAAFLTIVGYTINDTVIVYDRIRENQNKEPDTPLSKIVNISISQTMNRTILTSATGISALLVLTLMGGGALEDFALTMLIGIIVGTYSSIYVAAPLTLMMDQWLPKSKHKQDPHAQTAALSGHDASASPVFIRKKIKKS